MTRPIVHPQLSQSHTPQLIIEGALAVMAEKGLSRMTTKRVSARADVSTAAIHYFFDTKDNLVAEAFQHIVRTTRRQLLCVRQQQSDPLMRIRKMLDVFFDDEQLSEDYVKIWPQFWVHAGVDARTGRLFRIYNSRMLSNFKYDLCAVGMTRRRAHLYALRLNALHRGLWMEQNIGMTITSDDTNQIYDDMINLLKQEAGDAG